MARCSTRRSTVRLIAACGLMGLCAYERLTYKEPFPALSMLDYQQLQIVWSRSDQDLKDSSRKYALPPGEFPSVTQVLDSSNDFLWVHLRKIEEEVNLLSELAAKGQDAEVWTQDEDGKWVIGTALAYQVLRDGSHVSKAGLRYMKRAADRGTGLHFLFEAWAQGIRPCISEAKELSEWITYEHGLSCDVLELQSYLEPAIAWLDQENPEFQYPELVVFDTQKVYAGRTDSRLMRMKGVDYIADIKSSDSFSRRWAAQLAAYRACPYGYILSRDGSMKLLEIEQRWREVPGCIIMCVPGKCGHRVISAEEMDYYRDAFYAQLEAYTRLHEGAMPKEKARWVKYEHGK